MIPIDSNRGIWEVYRIPANHSVTSLWIIDLRRGPSYPRSAPCCRSGPSVVRSAVPF
jgi:hypothetical protein